MKRFSLVFITIISLFALCAGMSIHAAALESEGQCGESVYYSFDAGTAVLNITGSGEMTDFDGEQAVSPFAGNTAIQKVVFARGVTSVGSGAFAGCTNLASVELPDTVATIGTRAFSACVKLTDVRLLARQTAFGTALARSAISRSVTVSVPWKEKSSPAALISLSFVSSDTLYVPCSILYMWREIRLRPAGTA